MTLLMFTIQDDIATGLPLSGTSTSESTQEDREQDTPTADEDTERKTSSGGRDLSEVIHLSMYTLYTPSTKGPSLVPWLLWPHNAFVPLEL